MFVIASEPWDGSDGADLRAAQRRELDERYGSDDHEPGIVPTGLDIDVFLVARDRLTGNAIGCGALRRLDAASAEIKRMFVIREARGTGVATAILRALEGHAAALGCATVLLETGTLQPDAVRFYRREGYVEVKAFGPYRDATLSRCFGRVL